MSISLQTNTQGHLVPAAMMNDNFQFVQAFQSEDELVFALTGQGRVLLNKTLKELEARLDPDQFHRVHKQAIVNLSCISEIEPLAGAGALAKLQNGQHISVSRRFAYSLKEKLGW